MLQLNLIQKNDYIIVKIEGDNFTPQESTEEINRVLPELIGKGVLLDGRSPGWMIGKFGAILANKCKWIAQLNAPIGKAIVFVSVGSPVLLDREIDYNQKSGELNIFPDQNSL